MLKCVKNLLMEVLRCSGLQLVYEGTGEKVKEFEMFQYLLPTVN